MARAKSGTTSINPPGDSLPGHFVPEFFVVDLPPPDQIRSQFAEAYFFGGPSS